MYKTPTLLDKMMIINRRMKSVHVYMWRCKNWNCVHHNVLSFSKHKTYIKYHCDGTNIFSSNFGLGLGEWILKGHVLISNVAKKNFQTFFSVPKNPNIFTSLMVNIHNDASFA